MTPSCTTIGIAVVEREGCYLVGVRGPHGPLPGYSEFPGGKCVAGETPAECARRECQEETGLDVRPVRLLQNVRHSYPHGEVDLHFWLCEPTDPRAEPGAPYGWLPRSELGSCRFPEANQPLINQLLAAETS